MAEQGLTLYELLDVMASAHDRINTLWNFFVTIHLAILGALIVLRREVGWMAKFVVLFAYCGFSWVNYNAVIDAYGFLLSVSGDIAAFGLREGQPGYEIYFHLLQVDMEERINLVPYIHPLAAGIVVLLTLTLNLWARGGRFTRGGARSKT